MEAERTMATTLYTKYHRRQKCTLFCFLATFMATFANRVHNSLLDETSVHKCTSSLCRRQHSLPMKPCTYIGPMYCIIRFAKCLYIGLLVLGLGQSPLIAGCPCTLYPPVLGTLCFLYTLFLEVGPTRDLVPGTGADRYCELYSTYSECSRGNKSVVALDSRAWDWTFVSLDVQVKMGLDPHVQLSACTRTRTCTPYVG